LFLDTSLLSFAVPCKHHSHINSINPTHLLISDCISSLYNTFA
jgi:hypothetical protein